MLDICRRRIKEPKVILNNLPRALSHFPVCMSFDWLSYKLLRNKLLVYKKASEIRCNVPTIKLYAESS